jgi:hypothetical protein
MDTPDGRDAGHDPKGNVGADNVIDLATRKPCKNSERFEKRRARGYENVGRLQLCRLSPAAGCHEGTKITKTHEED